MVLKVRRPRSRRPWPSDLKVAQGSGVETMTSMPNFRAAATKQEPTAKRGVSLLTVAMLLMLPASRGAAEEFGYDPWGFGFCKRPEPPHCVKQTTNSGAAFEACQSDVRIYIASVAAFRICHLKQLEQVILQANETSDLMKCRAEKKRNCAFGQK